MRRRRWREEGSVWDEKHYCGGGGALIYGKAMRLSGGEEEGIVLGLLRIFL